MKLQELTGYESGLVIYNTPAESENESIITNWSSIDGIPRFFAGDVIGIGDGDDLEETTLTAGERLEALTLVKKEGYPDPVIAKAYRNDDVLVVVFEGWN